MVWKSFREIAQSNSWGREFKEGETSSREERVEGYLARIAMTLDKIATLLDPKEQERAREMEERRDRVNRWVDVSARARQHAMGKLRRHFGKLDQKQRNLLHKLASVLFHAAVKDEPHWEEHLYGPEDAVRIMGKIDAVDLATFPWSEIKLGPKSKQRLDEMLQANAFDEKPRSTE